ncbi:hypothetical protein BATDEDRAFT_92440 [Batrachochytrium dendrobatidis JAM81]|uniref:Uncharacterized protein n=1 Tax=Batrachochytrium dendrobatidis (strain JAM81 / FGSC 10211) TaxID=684364 RepID=F4PD68_BATDJ|nr:uncharacterized protein BATDEDRAFT_92440 [Batrachochytrium dendrobatidis JAM81]EGF76735.1 hypothetical protein BATDEDRAFT_92440 [Batrachochytrium dendrobatidis JAM81]|eukprot:XP_006682702.1 hypothetical protein BATDEDRAFT_92440 [Batrachochytrium dendrobatidis JAM81]
MTSIPPSTRNMFVALQQTNKRLCNAHCVCYTNNIIDGQYTQVLLMYTLSSKAVFFVAGKSWESCTLSCTVLSSTLNICSAISPYF